MRLQAYTHSVVGAEGSSPAVLASGTVTQFCGGLGQWFIVFDSEELLPQWKDLVGHAQEEDDFLENEDAVAGEATGSNYFAIISGAFAATNGAGAQSSRSILTPWLERRAEHMRGIGESFSADACSVCLRGANVGDGSACDENVAIQTCCRCGIKCHRRCMPMSKIGLAETDDEWWCWGCSSCQSCAQPSWERQQYMWNVKRADIPLFSVALVDATREADAVAAAVSAQRSKKSPPGGGADLLPYDAALGAVADATAVVAAAEPMVLAICAECMYRYKHAKEYCPLCYQLYAEVDTTTPPAAPMIEEGAGAAAVASETEIALAAEGGGALAPVGAASNAMDVSEELVVAGGIDADSMVQCNDCSRWVHAVCEGIDQMQYDAITLGTHPVWGDEYLCPVCRVQVPLRVIKQLKVIDKLDLFAEPVNEAVAPTYFDIIRNPMDLSSITGKASRGMYKSLQALRYDFELMCLNALIFNKVGDEYWLEAKIYYERGCRVFAQLPRKTTLTPLGLELREIIKTYKGGANDASLSASSSGKASTSKPGSKKAGSSTGGGAGGDRSSSAGSKGRGRPASSVSVAADTGEVLCLPAVASRKPQSGGRRTSSSADPSIGTVILPSQKSVPNDPKNNCCNMAPALIMTAEESVYNCCLDMCLVCASSDASNGNAMIHCVDCGECFHRFCVDVDATAMWRSWRCANCKFCECCYEQIYENSGNSSSEPLSVQADRFKKRKSGELSRSALEDVDSRVMFCDCCDGAYHIRCVQPAAVFPSTATACALSWICPRCVDCPVCRQEPSVDSKSWGYARFSPCSECVRAGVLTKLNMVHGESLSCCVCSQKCSRTLHPGEASGDYIGAASQARPFVNCTRCANVCHVACHLTPAGAKSTIFPIIEGPSNLVDASSSIESYLCPDCSSTAAINVDITHLKGTSDLAEPENVDLIKEQQWNLNDLVGQIGRKRSFMETADSYREADEIIMSALSALNVPGNFPRGDDAPRNDCPTPAAMYRAVIQWGFLRCYQLQYEIGRGLLIATSGGIASGSLTLDQLFQRSDLMQNSVDTATTRQQWLRSRALRFVAMWNRRCQSDQPANELYTADSAEGVMLRELGMHWSRIADLPLEKARRLLGLDDDGFEYEPRTLIRLASSAAGLLHYTNFELMVPQTHKDPQLNTLMAVELARIVKSVRAVVSFGLEPSGSPPNENESVAESSANSHAEKSFEGELRRNLYKMFRNLLARPLDRSTTVTVTAPGEGNMDAGAEPDPPLGEQMDVCTDAENLQSTSYVTVPPALLHLPLKSVEEIVCETVLSDFPDPVPSGRKLTRNQELFKSSLGLPVNNSTTATSSSNNLPMSASARAIITAANARLGSSIIKSEKKSKSLKEVPVHGSDGSVPVETTSDATQLQPATVDAVGEEAGGVSSANPGPVRLMVAPNPAKKQIMVAIDTNEPNCYYFNGPDSDTTVQSDQNAPSSLRGWRQLRDRSSVDAWVSDPCPWVDNRICCLCGGPEHVRVGRAENPYEHLGRLIPYPKADTGSVAGLNHSYVHVNCVRFAADVYEHEGVLFNTDNAKIRAALAVDPGVRAKPTICFCCNLKGATVVCNRKGCSRAFHLPCAIACKCALFETRYTNGEDVDSPYDLHTCMVCPEHIGFKDDVRSKVYLKANAAVTSALSVLSLDDNSSSSPPTPPVEPSRRIVINDFSDSSHRTRLATTLSTVKGEKVVRSGACSILNVGTPRIDSSQFHDKFRIYPHYFNSMRIFWSMKFPRTRTVYRFQILTQGDLSVSDYDRLLCRPSSRHYSTSQRRAQAFANLNKNGSGIASVEVPAPENEDATETADDKVEEEARPVFQVIAMDDWQSGGGIAPMPSVLSADFVSSASATPYFRTLLSFSMEELYQDIISAVKQCNLDSELGGDFCRGSGRDRADCETGDSPAKEDSTVSVKPSLRTSLRSGQATQVDGPASTVPTAPEKSTYGRNAYQFFGLTLPFVRHSIENLIESVASMIVPSNPAANVYPYSPCFKLPTPEAVLRIQQYQADLRSSLSTSNTAGNIALLSLSGSARTDVRNIILHNANPTDESTHKTFKVLAKNVSRSTGPKKSNITDLSTLLKRSNKAATDGELDQDKQDDAIFGEDESEYLDWYNIQNNNSSSAGFNLSAAQLRIIDRNRRRYAELSNSYEENSTRRLHVQKSHIHGFGLFAKTHFSKHEMIVEYIGEKIRQVVADKRESRYEDEGTGSCYLFRLDKEDIIDATKLGGMARFVNHSCCPNAYARVVATDELFKEKHIIIFAGRDILVRLRNLTRFALEISLDVLAVIIRHFYGWLVGL